MHFLDFVCHNVINYQFQINLSTRVEGIQTGFVKNKNKTNFSFLEKRGVNTNNGMIEVIISNITFNFVNIYPLETEHYPGC